MDPTVCCEVVAEELDGAVRIDRLKACPTDLAGEDVDLCEDDAAHVVVLKAFCVPGQIGQRTIGWPDSRIRGFGAPPRESQEGRTETGSETCERFRGVLKCCRDGLVPEYIKFAPVQCESPQDGPYLVMENAALAPIPPAGLMGSCRPGVWAWVR
ncbi:MULTISPECIES: hypothetical protein [Streptomyces]|uniref:Uncharacterized protein n=1 Tax=Streptomyces ehimensis TaxID=68195 RepID=A0ABV9BUY0_9ACTN